MAMTWNRWIRRQFYGFTAQRDPTFTEVRTEFETARDAIRGRSTILLRRTSNIQLRERDSIAWNMARAVYLRQVLTETPRLVWDHDDVRRTAHDRFNFVLVPLARQAGINVRASNTIHGDVPWNVMRMRWLEDQCGHLLAQRTETASVGFAAASELQAPELERMAEAAMVALDINDLTFGVEIECIHPQDMSRQQLAEHLVAAGVIAGAEFYDHRSRPFWKITTDGSLSDRRGYGCEVVSPILQGEDGLEQLRKVCETLTRHCRINRTCGLHVHVGMRGRPTRLAVNLLRMYNRFETVIDTLMSVSRRASANAYCRPVTFRNEMLQVSDMSRLRDLYGMDRYRKVNLESYWRHGTIEFRQHQGTTDAEKARNWVLFCLKMFAMANANANIEESEVTLDGLMTLIAADETAKSYFARRQALLAVR